MIPPDNDALLSRVSKAANGTDIAYKDMVLCQVESLLMGDPLAPPPDSGGVKPFDLNDPRPIWEQGRPDWQQDQAETSVLPRTPSPSAEPVADSDEFGYRELGEAFFEEFKKLDADGNFKGFICGSSPVEILVHLINERDEALASPVSDARGREALTHSDMYLGSMLDEWDRLSNDERGTARSLFPSFIGRLEKLKSVTDNPNPAEPLDPPAVWLDGALRNLARELLADPKTHWIGERDPTQHICWTAADRLAALSFSFGKTGSGK